MNDDPAPSRKPRGELRRLRHRAMVVSENAERRAAEAVLARIVEYGDLPPAGDLAFKHAVEVYCAARRARDQARRDYLNPPPGAGK